MNDPWDGIAPIVDPNSQNQDPWAGVADIVPQDDGYRPWQATQLDPIQEAAPIAAGDNISLNRQIFSQPYQQAPAPQQVDQSVLAQGPQQAQAADTPNANAGLLPEEISLSQDRFQQKRDAEGVAASQPVYAGKGYDEMSLDEQEQYDFDQVMELNKKYGLPLASAAKEIDRRKEQRESAYAAKVMDSLVNQTMEEQAASQKAWLESKPGTPERGAIELRNAVTELAQVRKTQNTNPLNDDAQYLIENLPVAGYVTKYKKTSAFNDAMAAIKSGNYTPDDIAIASTIILDEHQKANEGKLKKITRAVGDSARFMAEMTLTNPLFKGGAGLAGKAMGLTAAESAAGVGEIGLAKYLATRGAGVAAQALPTTLPQAHSQTQTDYKMQDDGLGHATALAPGDKKTVASQVASAFVDQMIEIGTEYSGQKAMMGLKKTATAPLAGMSGDLMKSSSKVARRLGQQLNHMRNTIDNLGAPAEAKKIGFIQELLTKGHFNGVPGEVLEERVGDFLRTVTGLAKPDDTQLGLLAQGKFGAAADQALVELASFAIPGMAGHFSGTTVKHLQQGLSERAESNLRTKVAAGSAISRGDLERIGIKPGKSTQEQRKEIAQKIVEILDQQKEQPTPVEQPAPAEPNWAEIEKELADRVLTYKQTENPVDDGFGLGSIYTEIAQKHGVSPQELYDRTKVQEPAEQAPPGLDPVVEQQPPAPEEPAPAPPVEQPAPPAPVDLRDKLRKKMLEKRQQPTPVEQPAPAPAPTLGENIKKKMLEKRQPIKTIDDDSVADGQPVTITGFHGSGREDVREVYHPDAPGAILGTGIHIASSEKDAADYGPKVEKREISLKKPAVLTNTFQFLDLAGAEFAPTSVKELSAMMQKVRENLEAKGYDGVVVRVPGAYSDVDKNGANAKRLREWFGVSQAIAFTKPEAKQEQPPAEKPKPGNRVAELQKKLLEQAQKKKGLPTNQERKVVPEDVPAPAEPAGEKSLPKAPTTAEKNVDVSPAAMRRRGIASSDTLDRLDRLSPEEAGQAIQYASDLAKESNERVDAVRSEFRSLFAPAGMRKHGQTEQHHKNQLGANLTNMIRKARSNAQSDGHSTFKNWDLLIDRFQNGDYENLRSHKGFDTIDPGSGLFELLQGGLEQFGSTAKTADYFIDQAMSEIDERDLKNADDSFDFGSDSFQLEPVEAEDKSPIVEQFEPKRIEKKSRNERQPIMPGMPEDMNKGTLEGQQGLFSSMPKKKREPHRHEAIAAGIKYLEKLNPGVKVRATVPRSDDHMEAIRFAEMVGAKEPIFYAADKPIKTAGMSYMGHVFIHSKLEGDALWSTVAHELAHDREIDALLKPHPELLQEYIDERLARASDFYRKQMEADPDLMRREGVAELIGQLMSDAKFRSKFFKKLSYEEPTLLGELLDAIARLLDRYRPKAKFAREAIAAFKAEADKYNSGEFPALSETLHEAMLQEHPDADTEMLDTAIELVVASVEAGAKDYKAFIKETVDGLGMDSTKELEELLRDAWDFASEEIEGLGKSSSWTDVWRLPKDEKPAPPKKEPAPKPAEKKEEKPAEPKDNRPASPVDNALAEHGLIAKNNTTQRGDFVIEVSGSGITKHKDLLTNLGAKKAQRGTNGVWVRRFYEKDGHKLEGVKTKLLEGLQREQRLDDDFKRGLERTSPVRTDQHPDGKKVITARWEYTADEDVSSIAPSIAEHLGDHQKMTVAKAIKAMSGPYGGFLDASGTGAGKTRSILAVAKTFADKGHPVVIIAPNEALGKPFEGQPRKPKISGSFANDSKAMGIDIKLTKGVTNNGLQDGKIYVTTYGRMKTAVSQAITGNTVVIFDEAHNLKNLAKGTPLAIDGNAMAQKALSVMYVTATPVDQPPQVMYLERIGAFEGRPFSEAARALGLVERKVEVIVKDANGKPVKGSDGKPLKVFRSVYGVRPGVTTAELLVRLNNMFDRVTAAGGMIKHELSMEGVNVEIKNIKLPSEARKTAQKIAEGMDGMPDRLIYMAQRRQEEPYKVDTAVKMAKEELAKGRKVILFVSRVNFSEAGRWVEDANGDRVKMIFHDSEGTSKLLRKALEDAGVEGITELHGNAPTKAAEAMRQFQGDEAKVLIATIESGGTGVNLDDLAGDSPRTMIIVTSPFSAVHAVQAAGRIWRLNTKSEPTVRFIFGDSPTERRNASIIARKMKTLHATVKGDVDKLDVDEVIPDEYESRSEPTPGVEEGVADNAILPPNNPGNVALDPVPIKPMRNIIEDLAKALDIPIRFGNIRRRGVGGFYDKLVNLIVSRFANDIPVVTHEVGHRLDNQFNFRADPAVESDLRNLGDPKRPGSRSSYTPSRGYDYLLGEGVAEFVRYWMTDKVEAKKIAPDMFDAFERVLKANDDLGSVLRAAQKDIEIWKDSGAHARVRSHIVGGGPTGLRLPRLSSLTYHLIDDMHYLRVMTDEALLKVPGLRPKDNPYILARLLRGSYDKAHVFINDGIIDFHTKEVLKDTSLKHILSPVKDRLTEFGDWIVAMRARELHRRGKTTGLNKKDVLELAKKYENDQAFVDAFEGLKTWQTSLLKYAVDAGLLARKDVRRMLRLNRDYVPFHRVYEIGAGENPAEDTKGIGTGLNVGKPASFRTLKGSTRSIVDPLETIIKNAYVTIAASERAAINRALARMADGKKVPGMAKWIREVPNPLEVKRFNVGKIRKQLEMLGADLDDIEDDEMLKVFLPASFTPHGRNIIRAIVGGKARYYEVNSDLYRTFQSMDFERTNLFVKYMFRPLAQLLRAGVTLAPDFQLANMFRDAFGSSVLGEHGMIPFQATTNGLLAMIKDKDVVAEYRASGGGNSVEPAFFDAKKMKSFIDRELGRMSKAERGLVATQIDRFWRFLDNIGGGMRYMGQVSEETTRVGEFERAFEQYTAEGMSEGDARLLAAFEARDRQDFAKGGASTKAIRAITAFANAQVQGNIKIGQAFRANPIGFMGRGFTFITVPTLLLMAVNGDDDDYWARPQWERDAFWLLPILGEDDQGHTKFLKLPKPFLLGAMFGAVPERLYRFLKEGHPESLKDIMNPILENVTANPVPQSATLAFELATGWSLWRGRNIVNATVTDRLPEDQWTERTSALARKAGESLGVSPMKIDYAIEQMTGGMGKLAAAAVSDVFEFIKEGDAVPDKVVDQLTRRFVTIDLHSNSQATADFYATWSLLRAQNASHRELGKGMAPEELPLFDEVARTMTKLRREIAATTNESERSALQERIFLLARAAQGMWRRNRGFKQSLAYPNVSSDDLDAIVNSRILRAEKAATPTVSKKPPKTLKQLRAKQAKEDRAEASRQKSAPELRFLKGR